MSLPLTRLGKSGFQIVNIENDASCNLVYVGWAKPGSADADFAWVIVHLTNDAGGCLERLRYATLAGDPADALSYDKQWTARGGYVYV